MASVDVTDETVILVAPAVVARVVADRRRWASWWPGLQVTLTADRGEAGMTWQVTGPLVGESEIRLQPHGSGVVVHYRLVADPAAPGGGLQARNLPDSPHGRREIAAIRRRQVVAWKRTVWSLRDELEGR